MPACWAENFQMKVIFAISSMSQCVIQKREHANATYIRKPEWAELWLSSASIL
jgi:hypothetical protein